MNTDLIDNIDMILGCEELQLKDKHRIALEDAKICLDHGYNMTSSQSGFYGAVKNQVLSINISDMKKKPNAQNLIQALAGAYDILSDAKTEIDPFCHKQCETQIAHLIEILMISSNAGWVDH
jgi:hypothetical protein